jgi:hypothetical protein
MLRAMLTLHANRAVALPYQGPVIPAAVRPHQTDNGGTRSDNNILFEGDSEP